jgi:hypothetical protein
VDTGFPNRSCSIKKLERGDDSTQLRSNSRSVVDVAIPLPEPGDFMRAYVLRHYGGPEGSLLMDVPAPAPGPRDILVQVRAAGLNL